MMKTLTPLLLFVLIAATAPSFAQSEKAPGTRPGSVSYSDDEYDLLFEYPCGNATGEAGIETDGTYIYTSLWNGAEFCKYASDGTYLGTFSIPGVAAVRDMAYDGTYFYGAAANTTIFKMDFENLVLVGTIAAPVATRAIAYSQDYYDSFYVNNWSTPIVHFDILGQILNTIQTAGDESYYGFAYDEYETFLWGYSQEIGTSQNMLYKMELPSGWIVESFDVCTILSLPTPGIDIAGGLFINQDLVWESITIGGIVQNVCLWGLELYPFPQGPQYDVGVHSFISPAGGPYLGEEIVTIRVKNFSTSSQVISNIPVYYTLDGGTPVTGVVPGPIAPGQTEDFTFPGTVNLSNPGQSYVFYGCTTLEGDDNPANDCKTVMIVGWPVYCDASTTNQEEYIKKVECGTISNLSDWQAGVADFTDLSTAIAIGWSEPISITNYYSRVNDSVTVWIDWNQDFIFGNVADEVFPLTDLTGSGHYFDGVITVPEDTPPGEYRMRIRLVYNSTPEPCGVAEFGEIEDYTIVAFTAPVNDVGALSLLYPPQWGVLPDNVLVTISVKNFGTAPQYDIPVSYTVDNGNVVNGIIKGPLESGQITNFTFPGFANLAIHNHSYSFYYCTELANDVNPANDCKTGESINHNPAYSSCETQVQDEYIANVLFGNINNSSGWQYETANYTALFNTLEAGTSDSITITNGNAWASDYVTVWVDWNKDYEFNYYNLYQEEEYPLTNVGGTGEIFTGNIQVPDGQASGAYRMRIRMTYNYPPPPCGTATYGETEDYTLIVKGPVPPEIRPGIETICQNLLPGQTITQSLKVFNSGEFPLNFEITLIDNILFMNKEKNTDLLLNNDVGVETILSPTNGINAGGEVVSIRVKNFGNLQQSNIPVLCTTSDGDSLSGIIPDILEYGATADYTFSGLVNFESTGETLGIKTSTFLQGDQNKHNDYKSVILTNAVPVYCDAITTTEDEFISNVLFGNINNSSGWQDSIADFTNLSTTIEAGASENIMVTNGLPYTNDLVTAWVDWNKDFDFNSANEQYILTNQNGTGETFTGEISVPENQPSGDYRLRLRMCYYTEPVPCGGSTYGEVEEYSIHVANNQTIPWLAMEPMTGVINPNDSTTINVTFDATGLQNGLYEGSIVINSNDPGTPFTTIPVMLIVGQCPLPPPLNPEGYEILPNIAYLSWQAPEIPGDLLGYNVYRDNEKINDTLLFNLFYEDSLANPQQYFYFITAVYPECEASSDTISLIITNLPEMENDGVRIFPNPAGNFVTIQSEIKISRVTIMNNLGEIVFTKENPGEILRVNTSCFRGGIYLVQFHTFEGILFKKLIIN